MKNFNRRPPFHRLKGDYARELEVTAYVKEELTERVQNATSHVTVYRYPYRLSLIRTSDSFKPGLTYTAFVSDWMCCGGCFVLFSVCFGFTSLRVFLGLLFCE